VGLLWSSHAALREFVVELKCTTLTNRQLQITFDDTLKESDCGLQVLYFRRQESLSLFRALQTLLCADGPLAKSDSHLLHSRHHFDGSVKGVCWKATIWLERIGFLKCVIKLRYDGNLLDYYIIKPFRSLAWALTWFLQSRDESPRMAHGYMPYTKSLCQMSLFDQALELPAIGNRLIRRILFQEYLQTVWSLTSNSLQSRSGSMTNPPWSRPCVQGEVEPVSINLWKNIHLKYEPNKNKPFNSNLHFLLVWTGNNKPRQWAAAHVHDNDAKLRWLCGKG